MEDKIIDFNQTVHDICTKYPEIKKVMIDTGFKELEMPGMLQSAGRFMTIPKGAKLRSIDLELIKQNIKNLGFEIKE